MLNYHHLRYFWVVAHEGSVSRAAKRLRVTQPTVSGQLRELQDQLGEELFRRAGRGLELTELGKSTLVIADEIFALGEQLLETVRGNRVGRPLRLAVGLSDAVPKHVAYQILEGAVAARIQIACHEDTPSRLLADLASHTLDVVISDAPSHAPTAHDHLLGEVGVAVWGVRRLAHELRAGFPRSLDGAPFLMPLSGTGLRRELDAWFVDHGIKPRIVAELEDAALLARFAAAGAGLYADPDLEGDRPRGMVRAGSIKSMRVRYYAITVERRLAHPAIALVAGAEKLFGKRRASRQATGSVRGSRPRAAS
ncbi:MAG: LysR family transcriptional regulator, partial [Deltaproteobacteria bacterium]|nr:LysR family transcriptional regulator [Deltaproteobacteria bacterium]